MSSKLNKKINLLKKDLERVKDSGQPMLKSALLSILSGYYWENSSYKESFLSLYRALLEAPDFAVPHLFLYFILAPKYIYPPIEVKKDKLQHIEKELSRKNNFASHVIVSVIRYLRKDFNSMEKHLSRALDINPKNQYLLYYCARLFSSKGEYRKALNIYKKIYISECEFDFIIFDYFYDNTICSYALALDFWRKGDVDNASEIITDGIEYAHNVKVQLESNKEKVDKVYIKAVDIIEKRFLLFSEILMLDSQFKKIFESNTYRSLFRSLSEIIEFVRSSSIFSEVLRRKKPKREILNNPLGIIVVYGYIKAFCAACLLVSLKSVFPERVRKAQFDIDFTSFGLYKNFLLDSGFIKGKQGLDAVETFVSAMQHAKRKELWVREKELIKLLKPAYVLNGELSRYMAEKESQENKFRFLKEFIRQEEKRSAGTIIENIKAIIAPLKRKVRITEKPKSIAQKKKLEYEEEIDLKDENYQYSLLDVKIDYVNKEPRVYFKLFSKNKKLKARKHMPEFSKSEKNFALLTRLAVAMKVGEKVKSGYTGFDGWLHIGDSKGEHAGWCLYIKHQGIDELRDFLARCDIFNLKKAEKRQLIRTKKEFAKVRLAIPEENIDIKIENLKTFESRFSDVKGKSYRKGVERIHKLIQDALESYKELYMKSSTSPQN